MTAYHWPSWCRDHRRPHVKPRKLCLTNRDRRHLRRMLDRSASMRRHPSGRAR